MFNRTWRELVLIAIGLYFCASELASSHTVLPNLVMYALATALFSLRFFAARGLAVGVALGAIAHRWPALRLEAPPSVTWIWFAPFAVLALLCSRNLEEKFDRAPSRYSWLPNLWADLPSRDVRPLRLCMYALGALASVLEQGWVVNYLSAGPHWPLVAVGAIARARPAAR